jgi:hypothetical protein
MSAISRGFLRALAEMLALEAAFEVAVLQQRLDVPGRRSQGATWARKASRNEIAMTTAFAAIPDLSTPFVTDLGLIDPRCSTSLPE